MTSSPTRSRRWLTSSGCPWSKRGRPWRPAWSNWPALTSWERRPRDRTAPVRGFRQAMIPSWRARYRERPAYPVLANITQWNRLRGFVAPGSLTIRRFRCESSSVSPSMPVRNEIHTPPGTAVAEAPPTENLRSPRLLLASSRRDAGSNSTTALPLTDVLATTYRCRPAGSTERSLTVSPEWSLIRLTMAPELALMRRTVRRKPTHSVPLPPGATATNPDLLWLPDSCHDRVTARVDRLTWYSTRLTEWPAGRAPYTQTDPAPRLMPNTGNFGPTVTKAPDNGIRLSRYPRPSLAST